jgi:hypothetical protein
VERDQTDFTQINYGGHEWIVVGNDTDATGELGSWNITASRLAGGGSGIKSPNGTLTLLLRNGDNGGNGYGNSPFREGRDDSATNYSPYSAQFYINNPSGTSWATPNEYPESTLQKKLNDKADALPTREQQLIDPRTFAKTPMTDPWGNTADEIALNPNDNNRPVENQRYWVLSWPEWLQLTSTEARIYKNNVFGTSFDFSDTAWWLRSPRETDYYGYVLSLAFARMARYAMETSSAASDTYTLSVPPSI